MKTNRFLIAALFSLLVFACNDDNEGTISASITGKWQSDKADFKLDPSGIIPGYTITRDDVEIQLEFKSDGSVVLTDNKGTNTTGSYTLSGRQLALQVDYELEFTELAGTYNLQELTDTQLRISSKKDGTFKDPDSGQEFNGEITVTLYFHRP